MKPAVHMVCLDAPAPPDYGGAIDMYYKIESLVQAGLDIHLHYFHYKEGRHAGALQKLCASVQAYPRTTGIRGLHGRVPYIVHSRMNGQLIRHLNKDKLPVILQGVHTTGMMPYLKGRIVVVRMHNDEAAYYRKLAQSESVWWKKAFFRLEARLLERWQAKLSPDARYAFVTLGDEADLRRRYGWNQTKVIPSFFPWKINTQLAGSGRFCLYQGNLSVSENRIAALWLAGEVFKSLNIPFIVAGKDPGPEIIQALSRFPNVQLVANPSEAEMEQLIEGAHIHLLPSFNSTGLKLKLLHALFRGRYCITNAAGASGLGTGSGLLLAETAEDYQILIRSVMEKPFTPADQEVRKVWSAAYSNERKAEDLKNWLC